MQQLCITKLNFVSLYYIIKDIILAIKIDFLLNLKEFVFDCVFLILIIKTIKNQKFKYFNKYYFLSLKVAIIVLIIKI